MDVDDLENYVENEEDDQEDNLAMDRENYDNSKNGQENLENIDQNDNNNLDDYSIEQDELRHPSGVVAMVNFI